MAKRAAKDLDLDFAFYTHLRYFYLEKRGAIRQHYRDLTKKYLDFNDPGIEDDREGGKSTSGAFLRQPQFEALEMYVFLKEFLDNAQVHAIFKDWMLMEGRFDGRSRIPGADMFEEISKTTYDTVFSQMRSAARSYPNYIFALTMGTGKTILMATCIFYEFILANKWPKDKKYCHNALVFAPDKTVLQSLKEIQTFDLRLVVPPEYVNFLTSHIQFHFLDEAGTALSTLDRSRFNLVITNTQKIILKRQHKDKTGTDKLFGSGKPTYDAGSVYAEAADLYGFDQPESEVDLATNQRFEKLRRLGQLGIYVDEAHHAFGAKLAKDTGSKKDTAKTSLRRTIDELAGSLNRAGTHVVACYNYTGTPYVGQNVLPEVVYAYGLRKAIANQYLKRVKLHGYATTKDVEFIELAIKEFLASVADVDAEGMVPKLAIFSATVEEMQNVVRPAVEAALAQHGIPASRILVNVGDTKLTTNDDIREFNRLDTRQSEKQFILLVNKGKEGWNCRSLFGVALFRQPRSKIFVLQATMRCLRAVGSVQYTGQVFLSHDNLEILNAELQQNFRLSADDFEKSGSDSNRIKVRVVPPPRKIKLQRVRQTHTLEEKTVEPGFSLDLESALDDENTERYKLLHYTQEGLSASDAAKQSASAAEDLTSQRQQRTFTRLSLVAEVARYLNRSPIELASILDDTAEGTDAVIEAVNQFNELLYDWVIPHLFQALYSISSESTSEPYEVELVKIPEKGYYEISCTADKHVTPATPGAGSFADKSFHLDNYCFDSNPEATLFWRLLKDSRIKTVYFTGMLTHGQTDFYVQYIDPESHTVRRYYPDFLYQRNDDTYVIVEVKGENKITDPVVLAKAASASDMARASGMDYYMVGGQSLNLPDLAQPLDEH